MKQSHHKRTSRNFDHLLKCEGLQTGSFFLLTLVAAHFVQSLEQTHTTFRNAPRGRVGAEPKNLRSANIQLHLPWGFWKQQDPSSYNPCHTHPYRGDNHPSPTENPRAVVIHKCHKIPHMEARHWSKPHKSPVHHQFGLPSLNPHNKSKRTPNARWAHLVGGGDIRHR